MREQAAETETAAADVAAAVRRLFVLAERMRWRSYDPYDLLASPLLRQAPRISPLLARALIQAGRRLGSHPRRLLGIAPHEEAKAVADLLSTAALLADNQDAWARAYLQPLRERLITLGTATRHGCGWGLSFPYSSRFLHAPAREPNTYTTLCAMHALLDADRVSSSDITRQYVRRGAEFIVRDAGYESTETGAWFRYYPGHDSRVVNIQAMVAAVLARAGADLGETAYLEPADRAMRTVLTVQRPDGSWRYSEDGQAGFVDGFHTGFVLQGLSEYLRCRDGSETAQVRAALTRGLAFFRGNLLTDDGLPCYYAGGGATTDGQTLAQAVVTLAVCAEHADDLRAALRVWQHLRRGLLHRIGRQARSRRKGWLGQDYLALRWDLGPATLAGARLCKALRAGGAQVVS